MVHVSNSHLSVSLCLRNHCKAVIKISHMCLSDISGVKFFRFGVLTNLYFSKIVAEKVVGGVVVDFEGAERDEEVRGFRGEYVAEGVN